jgi:hypothetical protein
MLPFRQLSLLVRYHARRIVNWIVLSIVFGFAFSLAKEADAKGHEQRLDGDISCSS